MQSETQKHPIEEEAVKQLCRANGVTYENIAQEGKNISSLEIFFGGYPRMVGLFFFPSLCHLTIVDQSIKSIEALECCPLLRELWVVQCHLTEISGLQHCLQLQKLYLYDNQICEIKNLEMNNNIHTLWLNNNCIKDIQGLNTLQNLKELNLADNKIEIIGHSLQPNGSLQNLNVSGNKISSLKELTLLAHLPHLTELALNDPMSTPNPVCLLPNYATHVLYHMTGLQRLDTYDVSSKKMKEAAETIVMEKMLYYKMHVRAAQRALQETQLILMERKKSMSQLPEECIRRLSHTLKSLQRELPKFTSESEDASTHDDVNSSSEPTTDITHDPCLETKIICKIKELRGRLTLWTRRLERIEKSHERDLIQARSMMEYTVQFLLMELESVGNIHLEEGCTKSTWFTSCCDLLLSRFSRSDFKVHGITGIKINRVVRIHNRVSSLRFEDKLHSLLSKEECAAFSQCWLEYLFYMAEPENNTEKEEVLSIIEKGFKTADQYKSLVRDGAIPLSNSLSVTEQQRIEHKLRQTSEGKSIHSADTIPLRHCQIVVSKVFVGHSMPVLKGEPVYRSNYPSTYSVYLSVETEHTAAASDKRSYSLRKRFDTKCVPRQWFVFDHELVLPEYIIYFEYITVDDGGSALQGHRINQEDVCSSYLLNDRVALSMEPVLKPKPKLLSLDVTILLNVASATVLNQITVLNLHGNSLSRIKEISQLTALRHLTISFNEFTHLDDISYMPNLEFVDVSFNHLVTLEGMTTLRKLKQLDVSWNRLTKSREESVVLKKHTPALLKLDTRYNPWKKPEAVRWTMLGHLTTLTHLDDVKVTEEEAAGAVQIIAGSKINQESLLAHSRTISERPRCLSLLPTAQLLCPLSPAPCGWDKRLEFDWTVQITSLNFDGQRIFKLANLNKLFNLRWASFNDNDISNIEGLDCCSKLEELSFNNNSITTLIGLPKLSCLKKLSVNGNQLSSLDTSVLDLLPNLSSLSVENNCITSLYGMQRAHSLLELYIGNNQISTSRDIYYLKRLTSLIILDLYGNPLLEKLKDYRLYVMFHLPFLKALDCMTVVLPETESAKNMFGGRLTSDMVAEKLGHSNYTDITDLSLQSCSIRTVNMCPADHFSNLRSVNLDHNNLTSFSGLIFLPSVKALSLNHNQIESILPRQKTHQTTRQILNSKVHSSGYGKPSLFKNKREDGPIHSFESLMDSLEVLHLSHNGISNMANLQLSRLSNLKVLFLQDNEISQVEGLEGLHQLRELVLDKNRITVLVENSFITQTGLVELHLVENRIRELNHLNPLKELRKLFLDMNKLQDITEVQKLSVLPLLTELSVVGNPVVKNSFYRPAVVLCLTRLQVLDGVAVTPDERTTEVLLSIESSQCCQCSGAFLPRKEAKVPVSLPLMARQTSVRGTSGGLQNLMQGHEISPPNMDKAQSHQTFKQANKTQKHGNAAQCSQATISQIQRKGNYLTTTGLRVDGNRVTITYPNQKQENRFTKDVQPPHTRWPEEVEDTQQSMTQSEQV